MSDYIITDREFRLFQELIYRLTGINMTEAKRQLVQSRLQKRLRHHQLASFKEYYDLLMQEGEQAAEIGAMINCVTTNKTDFFREPHHFEFVSQRLVPAWIESANHGTMPRRVRVWHAGCSSGEEPYTMAIVLSETLLQSGPWDVRLLASDIDTNVLDYARAGVYDEARLAPVPREALRRYFLRGKGVNESLYKVNEHLRELITFRQINFRENPWPINPRVRFDVIFCRNVVIYFDKPTQRELFARFASMLQPGGFLFIGHSESLLGISDDFVPLGGTIFQLREGVGERTAA